MSARILELFPGPPRERALKGTYLEHAVHRLGSAGAPFVYANFVSSLDGRIALAQGGTSHVPKELTSANDFRLFLELHAQADCFITHGGYMRAIASGRLDDILQVGGKPGSEDLCDWRAAQGLPAQPAIVIASASLDFVLPESLARSHQQIYIATGERADRHKTEGWRRRGIEVIFAGRENEVEGGALTAALGRLGFFSLYLLAGPRMLETMLRDRALSRLYVTVTHRLLGGQPFRSMIDGQPIGVAGRLKLRSLYHDASSAERPGQWFAQFEPEHETGGP
jgi:riboflavin biosynthesis pyrimidine reductase